MLKGGSDADTTTPRVLLLLDWTARVNGSLDADLKLIAAYHAILLCALRALDDLLIDGSIMQTITVVTQSEAILRTRQIIGYRLLMLVGTSRLARSWVRR